jgi:hypothetical protein
MIATSKTLPHEDCDETHHTNTHKIQYNFPKWNLAPLQFYLVKHLHTKIVMKPITQTHVQNARQFSNFELGSTTILPNETLTHQDCDETHHTQT